MTTSALRVKHSCVSWIFIVNSHPYFTFFVGGGAYFAKKLLLVWEPSLISLLTSQMVQMHLIYREGMRPIQFVLLTHIPLMLHNPVIAQ